MTRRLVLVGPGRLGLSLAAELDGWPAGVTVVGRRPERPPLLDGFPRVAYVSEPRRALGTGSPLALLFCVRDDDLETAAAGWAAALADSGAPAAGRPGGVALHTSGAQPARRLSPLAAAGYSLGSWHPLVAVAAPRTGFLRGVTVGVEGEDEAARFGFELARRVGARPVRVPSANRARYHAAAVFAANFVVATLHAAYEELRRAAGGDVPPDALIGLARSALANVERLGFGRGVTGPLARGDVETVAAHLASLDPPRRALYRALGRELLEVVRPGLAGGTARRLEALLSEPWVETAGR